MIKVLSFDEDAKTGNIYLLIYVCIFRLLKSLVELIFLYRMLLQILHQVQY